MAAPGSPPGQGKPGPFGWTGVRTERYTRWKGNLEPRKKIVPRMIRLSVIHNIKNPGVIILIVLAWVFSVLFTVLNAGFGGVALEMDPDDVPFYDPNAGSAQQGVDISFHQIIMNNSQAYYDLAGLSPTYATTFSISGIPSGWSAFINQTSVGGDSKATLVVTPPEFAPPMSTAMIDVDARTGGRKDQYSTVTTIAQDPAMTFMKFGMTVEFDEPTFTGKAGSKVDVKFTVMNTGTMDDSYNVTILNKPSGWKVKAFVDGAETEVKTKTETIGGQDGPPGSSYTISYKTFSVWASPGDSAECVLEFDTETTSASSNTLNLATNSQADPLVFGTYSIKVELDDVEKIDLTGMILFSSVMALQVLWALFLAAVVGSKMIATDMNERSYNLYFSRPITKTDYLIGKFGTLNILLAMVTMVPTLVAYMFLVLLSDISDTYIWDHLWVWGAIVVQSMVVMLTFSTLSLAFSSLTSRRFYAAAAFVVIFIATTILAQIAMGGFGLEEGPLISLNDNFDIIGRNVFDMGDTRDLEFPWYYSVFVLTALWVVCSLAVWMKVERTELSE